MINFLKIFLLILFLTSFSNAKEIKTFPFLFESQKNIIQSNTNPNLTLNKKYSDFVFNRNEKDLIINEFPVSFNESNTVQLKQVRPVFDSNTSWRTVKDSVEDVFVPLEILSYEGIIEGEQDSKVFITYSSGNVFAYIRHSDGSIFSIIPEFKSNDIEQLHFIKSGEISANEIPYLCLTTENSDASTEEDYWKKHYQDKPLSPSKLIEVKVACEATSEFYDLFANIDKATAYIVSVIAQTSKIYEENINVRLKISYFLIWQNPSLDPYKNENLLSDKLWIMPTLWENKKVDRAIAVLFASLAAQQSGISVAGIAMGGSPGRGNLCNPSEGYCVIGIRGGVKFPTTNYCWDVNVAAHEIGHLFGSPHTHSCYWKPPMDTCVTQSANGVGDACIKNGNPVPRFGTIMSYCHLTNESHSVELKFHNKEIPLMRRAAEQASCAGEVPVPFVSLLEPLGGKSYEAGATIPIRWTCAKVSSVSLKYSENNGSTWIKIADNIPASDSIYYWDTPHINSAEIIVLIHDYNDVSVDDRSLVNFSILFPMLTLKTPAENDEFPQNSEIYINWNSVFADSVSIEFSSDNGISWSEIADTSFITSIKWKTPAIVSDNCIMRITSLDKNNLISQSGLFRIGVPNATILTPNGKEKLCVGEVYSIQWQSNYVNICFLDYSTDAGSTWRKVTLIPIDAKKQHYDWTVPDKITDSCLVRISTRLTDITVLDNSDATFRIVECPSSAGELNLNGNRITLSPNPVSNYLNIAVVPGNSISSLKNVNIYDLNGKHLIRYNAANNPSQNVCQIDVQGLNNGTYMIMLEFSDGFTASKFTILR